MWFSNYVLPVLIAIGVMLLVLWPTERSGYRLLVRWGVPQPQPDQVAVAVRYLWQRRILYVILFVALPSLAGPLLRDDAGLPGLSIVVPLVVAMLVAELAATLRPVGGVRVAALDRRGWRDLVPRWAVAVTAVLVALTVWQSVAGPTVSWLALGYAVAAVLLTTLLVWVAVRRPAVDDAAVDAALRTRTARVAVGIGMGWLGGAVAVADQTDVHVSTSGYVGLAAQLGAVVCWIMVANPTRRSLAAVRA